MAWTTPVTNWANNDLVSASHLNAIGNNLVYLNEPAFANVYNNGTVSIPNNAATAITFEDVRNETVSSMQGANQARLNAPYDGIYLLIGQVIWNANGTGSRYIQLTLNGSAIARTQRGSVSASYQEAMEVSAIRNLDAGNNDYIQLEAWQNSGASLDLTTTSYTPALMMIYLGKV
jgi:hypothetical protein